MAIISSHEQEKGKKDAHNTVLNALYTYQSVKEISTEPFAVEPFANSICSTFIQKLYEITAYRKTDQTINPK